jgi:folate-dependent phosphoribosylglycinamide formyltransferase PurN
VRVVFMGTPDFAAACLRAVAAVHEVALVVCQPDKPAGRGGQLTAPPVKLLAQELALPVIQPKSARTGELRDALAASGAELAIVVAYGKILPKDVLEALPRGCINVHASLLPKYRGAAPIQWAVIDGEPETGVSIMQLDEGMDTGPVLLERRIALDASWTSGDLFEQLSRSAPRRCSRRCSGSPRAAPCRASRTTRARPTRACSSRKTASSTSRSRRRRSPRGSAASIRGPVRRRSCAEIPSSCSARASSRAMVSRAPCSRSTRPVRTSRAARVWS